MAFPRFDQLSQKARPAHAYQRTVAAVNGSVEIGDFDGRSAAEIGYEPDGTRKSIWPLRHRKPFQLLVGYGRHDETATLELPYQQKPLPEITNRLLGGNEYAHNARGRVVHWGGKEGGGRTEWGLLIHSDEGSALTPCLRGRLI